MCGPDSRVSMPIKTCALPCSRFRYAPKERPVAREWHHQAVACPTRNAISSEEFLSHLRGRLISVRVEGDPFLVDDP